jgi:type I restriction enzyme S subunit
VARLSEGPQPFFRLSPVDRAKASCFGLLRGDIDGRADVNYWRLTPLVRHRFANPLFVVEPLGRSLVAAQYGSSALAHTAAVGVPILRMNNLQNDGWDLAELKYIELTDREFENYRIEPGDILFNRTNSKELVGKCEVFRESGDWVFASYLIRVRTTEARLMPQFVSDFLGAAIGRMQIDRVSRQIIGMTNINAEEIRELLIPVPPLNQQKKMIAAMDSARAVRREKMEEADALLAGMEAFLLNVLGLQAPPEDTRRVFAVRREQLESKAFSPSVYAPALSKFIATLAGGKYLTEPLSKHVHLNPAVALERLNENDPVSFLPMEAVDDGASGDFVPRTRPLAEVRKGYTPFADGDVLWAKITPCMENGKTCIASGLENGIGFGSTEFHILRPRSSTVTSDYVFAFLAQATLRRLARFAFTGSAGHLRVPEEFLAQLPLPVPPASVQTSIADEMRRRRSEAHRLRAEADDGWQAAKSSFEEQLLGPSPS